VARYPHPRVSEADDTSALLEEVMREVDLKPGTVLEGQEMIDLIEALLRERAHPDYETVMVPKEGPTLNYSGVDGFREAIDDWLSPWAKFRFEIEELIPVDDMIVMMVRQAGTTKHGGVEIATESGTIWWIAEGSIRRASFYLDRDHARKVAGIG
jgi:ketosteroid isomerase-like protein